MRHLACLSLMALLAACGGAPVGFSGVDPLRIKVVEYTIDVWVNGRWAAARGVKDPQRPSSKLRALTAAVVAIEKISKCRVFAVRKELAGIKAALDCGSGPPYLPPPEMVCDVYMNGDGTGKSRCRQSELSWVKVPE